MKSLKRLLYGRQITQIITILLLALSFYFAVNHSKYWLLCMFIAIILDITIVDLFNSLIFDRLIKMYKPTTYTIIHRTLNLMFITNKYDVHVIFSLESFYNVSIGLFRFTKISPCGALHLNNTVYKPDQIIKILEKYNQFLT